MRNDPTLVVNLILSKSGKKRKEKKKTKQISLRCLCSRIWCGNRRAGLFIFFFFLFFSNQDGRAVGGCHGIGNLPAAQIREPASHSVPSLLERSAPRRRRTRLERKTSVLWKKIEGKKIDPQRPSSDFRSNLIDSLHLADIYTAHLSDKIDK